MRRFAFHRPRSLGEAVAALRQAEDGRLLAGGQSLIPIMKLDLAQPSDLVSLAGIEELRGIRRERGTLVVGAGATHAEVEASPEVAGAIPALADLAGGIGDPQVRNRGTLGGSVAHADPAADYPAALLALGATLRTDRREHPAAEFFTGLYETALHADEIVTAVRFPIPEAAAWAKFPHPASKFAVVGVFVARTREGVRLAVTGARSRAFRVPPMEQALDADFRPEALAGVPIGDDALRNDEFASAEYRAHLVGVLAARAVARCA